MTTHSHTDGGWEADDTYYYRRGAGESTATAVVRAVGAVSGRSPIASESEGDEDPLEPLYETLDPDALEALFHDDVESVGSVRFEYCDHEVTVDGTGLVTVSLR